MRGPAGLSCWRRSTLPANTNPATEVKSLVADGKIAEVTAVRDAVKVLQGK